MESKELKRQLSQRIIAFSHVYSRVPVSDRKNRRYHEKQLIDSLRRIIQQSGHVSMGSGYGAIAKAVVRRFFFGKHKGLHDDHYVNLISSAIFFHDIKSSRFIRKKYHGDALKEELSKLTTQTAHRALSITLS